MPASRSTKPLRSSTTTRQVRDPEATKTQILDAAEEEFAKQGLVAARTEEIAAQTGVTKAMIYYYFGSKEELYRAVLLRIFSERLQSIAHIELDQFPPDTALEKFLRQFLLSMASERNLASILFLEAILNQGKYYPQETGELLYGRLKALLERGMNAGVFRSLDPSHTAVNIVGTCVFYFTAHGNLKFLWKGKRMLSKDMVEKHAQEAINLILAGVRLQP